MEHPVNDIRGRNVGFWKDDEVPRIYHTSRNFNLNQIFKSSTFNNEVGLDWKIIKKDLIPNNVQYLHYLIVGMEKISYHAYISLKRFLELGKDVDFEGGQVIVPLEYFSREHPKESLDSFKNEN